MGDQCYVFTKTCLINVLGHYDYISEDISNDYFPGAVLVVARKNKSTGLVNCAEDDVFVSFRTSMEISLDGGANWQILIIPIMPNVMGDNVLPGNSKCFIIELDDFFSNTYSSSVQVKVIAEGHEAIVLPWEDEMILIESGPFMSFGVNFNTPEFQQGDTLLNIDYDYEIMKYEVTNAQYLQFLQQYCQLTQFLHF